MALSADRKTQYREGIEMDYIVNNASQIYAGSLVMVNANGYLIPGADTASCYFAGVAMENVLGDGTKKCRVRTQGVFQFASSGLSIANLGDVVYLSNDETVLPSGVSNSVVAGKIVKVDSATACWVDISIGAYLSSTAAASISIADAGNFTSQTTAEAALQEIYQNMFSVQAFLSVPLAILREASNFNVGNASANGGVLASDTTPVLSAINGATDGCQQVAWAAGNADQVVFQIPLPPDLDDTKDVVIHFRTKSAGTTDAVGFTVDSFFNEGDTKVVDTSETNQTTSWAEKIATIANADVPSGAQTLTVGLTPATHATDIMYLSAIWIEYTKKLLTS